MKIYDKEIYNREQTIKSVVLVIVVFLLGFFTGFVLNNPKENTNQSVSNETEIIQNELNDYE